MLIPSDKHNPEAISYALPDLLGEKTDRELFERHVRNLPRLESIFLCAKLNLVASAAAFRGFSTFEVQSQMLKDLEALNWVSPFDLPALNRANHQPKLQILFGRQSLFEIIRWLTLWEGHVVDTTKQRMSFIRAVLQASDFATKRPGEGINLDEFSNLPNLEKIFSLLPLFRELTLWQTPTYDPRLQFGRSRSLFLDNFFASNPAYVSLLENELGMAIHEYMDCVIGAASIVESWFPDGPMPRLRSSLEFDLAQTHTELLPNMAIKFKKFIELESQTVDQLRHKLQQNYGSIDTFLELRPFRESPILTDGSQRAVVLDQTLLCERGSTGLVFRLLKHDNEVFSQFGHAFERYVQTIFDKYVTDIKLHNAHSQVSISGWGPVLNNSNQKDELFDYIMIQDDVAAVVEAKTGLIKESLVRQTSEVLWAELVGRHGSVKSKSKPGTKNKGVAQLANSIRKWIDGNAQVSQEGHTIRAKTIIPILVVFDPILPVLGFTKFLSLEFNKIFANGETFPKTGVAYNGVNVLSLCIMSIDQFELFEGSVLEKTLLKLALQYSNEYPERDVAFGQYLKQYKPDAITKDSAILSSSRQAMAQSIQTLFGRGLDGKFLHT